LRLVERVELRPDDVDPTFDVFTWNPRAAFADMLPETPQAVNFGNGVELVAYDLLTPEVAPGGTVTLVTFWRVRDPGALEPVDPRHYGRAAAIFVHALDGEGQVVGQDDRLDAPAWNWRAGDAFVQVHQIQLDADVPPGSYDLAVGIYNRHTMERLPVIAEGVEVDDRVFLVLVRVSSE